MSFFFLNLLENLFTLSLHFHRVQTNSTVNIQERDIHKENYTTADLSVMQGNFLSRPKETVRNSQSVIW